MSHPVELGIILAVFALFSAIGCLAHRWRRGTPATLEGWGLAGRRNGAVMTWLFLGATVFTAYTYVAVPALVAGSGGGLGLFALPYTILVWPLFTLVAPRFWSVARANRYVTAADFARGRHGSTALGVAVALTGLLATMPYLTLQLVGISAVLDVMGVSGDIPMILAFSLLAVATWRSGLRAPTLTAVAKDVLVAGAVVAALAVVVQAVGGLGHAYATAAAVIPVVPSLHDAPAYTTLVVGSALALFLYPHTVTAVLAARSRAALRRSAQGLPLFTLLLGVIAIFGILAVAAGLQPSADGVPRTLPQLVQQTSPGVLAGIVGAAIAVGALVPAAVMSIGAANLFARNIYRDCIRPDATEEQQLAVARIVSALAKLGAVAFVLALKTDDAIDLQLLGGVWILQTLPAVGFGLFGRWFHRWGLLAGWATGMALGTVLGASQGFIGIVPLDLGPVQLRVYSGLLALTFNVAVAGAATIVLRALRAPDGRDRTRPQDYAGVLGVPAAAMVARSAQ